MYYLANIDFTPLKNRIGEIFEDYMKINLIDIQTQSTVPSLKEYSSAVETQISGAADGKIVLLSDDTLANSISIAFSCEPKSITNEEVLSEVLNILLGNIENHIKNDGNKKLNFRIPKKSSLEVIQKQLENSRFCVTFKTEVSSGCCMYIQNKR